MTIWTANGPLPAVISRKPIHLLTDEERKQVVKLEDLWLDIGAKNKDEAKELVRIGDPDDAAARLSGDAERTGEFAGDGQQVRACGW